ncbi:MAG: YjbQ family protein [Deltaproteobacteria bacterium]|nr:YjbQ family protein [Deltaproteobacteria bacterium]
MKELVIETVCRSEMIDITGQVQLILDELRVKEGLCCLFTPHTTAALTINEKADPDVSRDILTTLDGVVPWSNRYRHCEGNSAAHIKASLLGASELLLVQDGRLLLGTWQAVFFCEFDGPRTRKIWVNVLDG